MLVGWAFNLVLAFLNLDDQWLTRRYAHGTQSTSLVILMPLHPVYTLLMPRALGSKLA